jgi:glutamyl-tRNA reductase
MNSTLPIDISNFFVAGINYKKTDAATRGMFAINDDQYANILRRAPDFNINSLFIISTCNRTEIYGFAPIVTWLIDLLCTQTTGSKKTFGSLAYIKNGDKAIEHLFEVGAGLDSQLLGDYEIVGQIKQAFKFSKDRNFINCFTERLVNSVLQSSKMIKNETMLSGGTVSVSFAAVQYIKENIVDNARKKILLVGTGKIGRNTCKNLVDYLGTTNITVINRSEESAYLLAAEMELHYAPLVQLAACVAASDIILLATNSDEPVILASYLKDKGTKLVIDLSIPHNVQASARALANITLINVDELSRLNDETLAKRKAEIPKAKNIIAQNIADFMDWHRMRQNAPMLNTLKTMLNKIVIVHQREFNNPNTRCPYIAVEQKIQRVINGLADKMRTQNQNGCHCIEVINEFILAADY